MYVNDGNVSQFLFSYFIILVRMMTDKYEHIFNLMTYISAVLST